MRHVDGSPCSPRSQYLGTRPSAASLLVSLPTRRGVAAVSALPAHAVQVTRRGQADKPHRRPRPVAGDQARRRAHAVPQGGAHRAVLYPQRQRLHCTLRPCHDGHHSPQRESERAGTDAGCSSLGLRPSRLPSPSPRSGPTSASLTARCCRGTVSSATTSSSATTRSAPPSLSTPSFRAQAHPLPLACPNRPRRLLPRIRPSKAPAPRPGWCDPPLLPLSLCLTPASALLCQCFVVFDVVLASGYERGDLPEGVLTGHPLRERHRVLQRLIRPVDKRLELLPGRAVRGDTPPERNAVRALPHGNPPMPVQRPTRARRRPRRRTCWQRWTRRLCVGRKGWCSRTSTRPTCAGSRAAAPNGG